MGGNQFTVQQHIEISRYLEPAFIQGGISRQGDDREINWADEIRNSDHRAESTAVENQKQKAVLKETEKQIEELESMVDTRDKEIDRLNNLYTGGERMDLLHITHVSEENKKTIQKLNSQIDFINKQNSQLTE